ncbi:hypothetical protein CI102_7410 [Trichoderma harzianum]|nr:hypothetical protein CI102_7410 [Trichoderma harzianum]
MSYEIINSKASLWLRCLGIMAGSCLSLPFLVLPFSLLYFQNSFMSLILAVSLCSSSQCIFIFSTVV